MTKEKVLLGLTCFDCDRDFCTHTWKDDNPDEVERLNEWGIMASNKEHDSERALFYFTKAIEQGNIYAMINGFSVLWSEQFFDWAYRWLQQMNAKPIKNPKCLWNEAMLNFYGKDIENNPVKKDKAKATELLKGLVSHYADYINDNREIVQRAYLFLLKHKLIKPDDCTFYAYELWKSVELEHHKNYSAIGTNLYYSLQEYHDFPWDVGQFVGDEWLHRRVFRHLDELYLDRDWELCITLGDREGFQVALGSKKQPLSSKLRGSICQRAAWQAYLLYTAYRIMPLVDHDNYYACRPIFTTKDLDLNTFASFIPESHYDNVINELMSIDLPGDKIHPSVNLIGTNQFLIACTWWNDWKGLFRERAIIEFCQKTATPTMMQLSTEILYPYECPIDL